MDPRTPPNDPRARQPLNDFIAECILVLEREGKAALDELLARVPEHAERARARIAGLEASGLLAQPAKDPEHIGPYRILQRIGSGGMGTVYLADQRQPVERRVAVKLIRPGMDTREVLARFAIERQALAMLDHPNIAKVLDAGATADGRPFLVMEYVPGVPITKYCDERRMDVDQRIELFCRVCEAVQHAHHKGLVHRDLKPSNVLVADRDGHPWPTVIDFGVAKSLSGRFTDVTLVTMRGHVLGTPEYMSPEQAANEIDIDTRADVFSLGVVLYELLTGTLPIGSATLRRATSDELQRLLRDTATMAPSRRARELAGAGSELAKRAPISLALCRRLRGDLDWIVLRALEKDRNRRYGMPGALAEDLRRHLRQEPVAAGPPSALYRWGKFLQRNRLQVASAAAVLLALVVGLVFSLLAYGAVAASARQSDADFDHALAAVEGLVVLAEERLVHEPQMDAVRRQFLEDALRFYQRIAEGRSDARDLSMRVVFARSRVGRIQHLMGNYAAALASLDQAGQQFLGLRREPSSSDALLVAHIENNRGHALLQLGRLAEAETALRAAAEQFVAHAASTPDADARAAVVRWRLHNLAELAHLVTSRDPVAARTIYERGLELAGPVLSNADRDHGALAMALRLAAGHAALILDLGQPDAAIELASALHPVLVAALPELQDHERATFLGATVMLANTIGQAGRQASAVSLLEQALAHQRSFAKDHPDQAIGHLGLGVILAALAGVWSQDHEFGKALAAQDECVRVHEQLVARSRSASHRAFFAGALADQVRFLDQQQVYTGESDDTAATAALQQCFDVLATLPDELRASREVRNTMTKACWLRARTHERAGQLDAAVADLERAVTESRLLMEATPVSVTQQLHFAENNWDLLRLLIARRQWARALAVADGIVDLGPKFALADPVAGADFEQRVRRYRMQALAGLGDVDGVLSEVRRPSAIPGDWLSTQRKAEALLLLVEQLPAADGRRPALLGHARSVLHERLQDGAADPSAAVMAAAANEVLVRVERAAGDLDAATAAANAAVAGYEPSFRGRANDKNRVRLAHAAEVWLQLLADRGDAPALGSGIERMASLFAGHGEELLGLAIWCGKLAELTPDADASARARDRGIALLRASVELGAGEAATLRQSAAFAPLRDHAGFASVLAAVRK